MQEREEIHQRLGSELTTEKPDPTGRLLGGLRSRIAALVISLLGGPGCDLQGLDGNFTKENKNGAYQEALAARASGIGPFKGVGFGESNVTFFGAEPVDQPRIFEITFLRDGNLIEGFTETLLPMEENLTTDLPEGIRTGDTMVVSSNNRRLKEIPVSLFDEPIEPIE